MKKNPLRAQTFTARWVRNESELLSHVKCYNIFSLYADEL